MGESRKQAGFRKLSSARVALTEGSEVLCKKTLGSFKLTGLTDVSSSNTELSGDGNTHPRHRIN